MLVAAILSGAEVALPQLGGLLPIPPCCNRLVAGLGLAQALRGGRDSWQATTPSKVFSAMDRDVETVKI